MNDDELKMMNSVEHGEWQSVTKLAILKSALILAATETAIKDKRNNIHDVNRDENSQVIDK